MKLAIGIAFMACALSHATTIDCGQPLADVTVLHGPDNCEGGRYQFGEFSFLSWGFNSATMSLLGDQITNEGTNLILEVHTDPDEVLTVGTSGWKLLFSATALTGLIDKVNLSNANGVGTTITETACKSDFGLNYGECPIGDVLGTVYAHAGETNSVEWADGVSKVYLRKQDNYADATQRGPIYDGVAEAPEPVTTGLIGAGLLVISLISRRRRKV